MVEAFAPETALMNSSTRLMVDLAWNLIKNPKKSCLKCQGLKYLSESCPRRCKWCLRISFLQTVRRKYSVFTVENYLANMIAASHMPFVSLQAINDQELQEGIPCAILAGKQTNKRKERKKKHQTSKKEMA